MSETHISNIHLGSHTTSVDQNASCKQTMLSSERDVKAELRNPKCSLDHRSHEVNNLHDSEGEKPRLSYIALISMAIQSSPDQKMLLSEIYHWICTEYPYYKMSDRSWRNSVRHNLSLNECFVKLGRSDSCKGSYWSIHPANMADFAQGDYRRRHARKRVRKCDADLQRLCSNQGVAAKVTEHVTMTRPNGYIPMTSTRVSADFPPAKVGRSSGFSADDWFSNGRNAYMTPTDHQHTYCCPPCPQLSAVSTPEPTVTVSLNVNLCGANSDERPPQTTFPNTWYEQFGSNSHCYG